MERTLTLTIIIILLATQFTSCIINPRRGRGRRRVVTYDYTIDKPSFAKTTVKYNRIA